MDKLVAKRSQTRGKWCVFVQRSVNTFEFVRECVGEVEANSIVSTLSTGGKRAAPKGEAWRVNRYRGGRFNSSNPQELTKAEAETLVNFGNIDGQGVYTYKMNRVREEA